MKLPYIKEVEYRRRPGRPGKYRRGAYRFGLHWAWVYLFMFNGQYILFPEADSMQLLLSAPHLRRLSTPALLLYAVFETGPPTLRHVGAHPPQPCDRGVFAPARRFCAWRGNMVSVGLWLLRSSCLPAWRERRGSAMLLMSFGVSFSVRPAHHSCARRSSMVVSARWRSPSPARRERAFVPAGAPSMSGSAIPRVALPEQMLHRSADAGVLVHDHARAHRLLRRALGVPRSFSACFWASAAARLTAFADLLRPRAVRKHLSFSVFAASPVRLRSPHHGHAHAAQVAQLRLPRARAPHRRTAVTLALYGAGTAPSCCFALFGSYFMLEACLWAQCTPTSPRATV